MNMMLIQLIEAMLLSAKATLQRFVRDERGDVNIVSIVVLIGVAVLLAIVFKDFVGNLLKNMLNTIGGKANGVITDNI